jgi:hypothetical protein
VSATCRTRPRGFAPWKPQPAGLEMVRSVSQVLNEYHAHLPLTLRQVFYRLVVKGTVEKTERGYKRLCELMNRARRAEMIPMDAIRNDGTTVRMAHDFESEKEVRTYLHEFVRSARMDLQRGQPERLELWCEAAGMVPQLQRVAQPYGIPVISSGGFDSLTAKHDMAERYSCQGRTRVLHIGDFDPSGVHIYLSLAEDIKAFTGNGLVEFERLAVLPEHINSYHLPTAPPKRTDRRSFADNRTVQAEAFDPGTLAQLVETAVLRYLDLEAYDAACEHQKEVRNRLTLEMGSERTC